MRGRGWTRKWPLRPGPEQGRVGRAARRAGEGLPRSLTWLSSFSAARRSLGSMVPLSAWMILLGSMAGEGRGRLTTKRSRWCRCYGRRRRTPSSPARLSPRFATQEPFTGLRQRRASDGLLYALDIGFPSPIAELRCGAPCRCTETGTLVSSEGWGRGFLRVGAPEAAMMCYGKVRVRPARGGGFGEQVPR